MVTIRKAARAGALVCALLLAGLCVQRLLAPPPPDITVSAAMHYQSQPQQQPQPQSQPTQHKPDIDLGKLGRAFRA